MLIGYRLSESNVFQEIFDQVVFLAISHRMVGGRVLISDSTHLKANANKRKIIREEIQQSTKSYIEELDDAVSQDREEHDVHDPVPYVERLEHQDQKFGFEESLEAVALDAGYLTSYICKKLHDKKLFAVIGGRAFTPVKGLFAKWRFKYNPEKDVYVCPQKQELAYATTEHGGYRMYKSKAELCRDCPMLEQCTR